MRIGIRTLLPHQFYLCNVQSYMFYEAFLNFTNSLWRKYVNQSWLLHKDFWYVYIIFIRVKKISFIYKSCKVDAIPSILRKITWIQYTILRNYSIENLNFAKLSETALSWKNSKFHKIRTLRWIFYKFNPKRRWTLMSL